MDRRHAILSALALPWSGVLASPGADAFWQRLRQGHCVVLMRHEQTVSGIGDPPGFRLGDCSTQRNLSDAGRERSRALGRAFAQAGVRPDVVLSSAWCRCTDTAALAFGTHRVWAPLNSFFGQGDGQAQLRLALQRVRESALQGLEVWVSHQVNISGLTGEAPAMGELFACDPVVRGGRLPLVARWSV
jgi:phosphohistidine phosphatase SixA